MNEPENRKKRLSGSPVAVPGASTETSSAKSDEKNRDAAQAPIGVVHIAGEFVGGVQRCTRCGFLVADYRNAGWPEGSEPPRGYAPGAVTFWPGTPTVSMAGADEDALPCLRPIAGGSDGPQRGDVPPAPICTRCGLGIKAWLSTVPTEDGVRHVDCPPPAPRRRPAPGDVVELWTEYPGRWSPATVVATNYGGSVPSWFVAQDERGDWQRALMDEGAWWRWREVTPEDLPLLVPNDGEEFWAWVERLRAWHADELRAGRGKVVVFAEQQWKTVRPVSGGSDDERRIAFAGGDLTIRGTLSETDLGVLKRLAKRSFDATPAGTVHTLEPCEPDEQTAAEPAPEPIDDPDTVEAVKAEIAALNRKLNEWLDGRPTPTDLEDATIEAQRLARRMTALTDRAVRSIKSELVAFDDERPEVIPLKHKEGRCPDCADAGFDTVLGQIWCRGCDGGKCARCCGHDDHRLEVVRLERRGPLVLGVLRYALPGGNVERFEGRVRFLGDTIDAYTCIGNMSLEEAWEAVLSFERAQVAAVRP